MWSTPHCSQTPKKFKEKPYFSPKRLGKKPDYRKAQGDTASQPNTRDDSSTIKHPLTQSISRD
jgi:hypothetical protein